MGRLPTLSNATGRLHDHGKGEGCHAGAQGDLKLLQTEIARRLLGSTIPARVAFIWPDGTPRIMSTWFHWTGDELVMLTFVAAPHVRHPAARIQALRTNPQVAITY
jgi:hypothetical protein